MYNPSAAGSASSTEYNNRSFLYEVVGLKAGNGIANDLVRKSGTTLITVPYNRMNQELQRITRLGGQIISIKPLDQVSATGA